MPSPMSKKFSHGIMECPFCHKEFKSLGIGRHRAKCYKEWQKMRYSPTPVPIQVRARFRPGKDWWDEKEERACQEISKMADERKKS